MRLWVFEFVIFSSQIGAAALLSRPRFHSYLPICVVLSQIYLSICAVLGQFYLSICVSPQVNGFVCTMLQAEDFGMPERERKVLRRGAFSIVTSPLANGAGGIKSADKRYSALLSTTKNRLVPVPRPFAD